MAVIIPPTPISDFPGPLPNVVDPAFRQQALQWVNHLTTVKIGEFNALLSNVNNNAQAAAEAAALAEEKAADAAASAVDAAAGAEAAAGATAAAGLASASAVSAGVSANTAASAAAASATSASGSASTATTQATAAGNSATAAAGSATTASTAKTAAETAATNAGNSASTASTKATEAGTAATAAGNSATAAAGSATSANTAKTAAETARDDAQTARTQAQTAATNAGTSATNAANSAAAAAQSAADAEAIATGDLLANTAPEALGTSAVGTSSRAARADHVHLMPTAAQVGAVPAAHAGAGGAAHANATTSVDGFMSSADKTKLNGVASGATANATDEQLRDRSTHTGTQAISTVSGLQTALDGKAAVGSTAGANLGTASAGSEATAARSDHVHKLPTAAEVGAAPASHASATDNPHSVTKAQVGLSNVDNVSEANLRDRATHTGTQAQSTVTNLTTDLAARVNRQDSYATVTSGVINLGLETELYHMTVSGNVTVSVSNAPSTARVVKRLIVQYSSGVVTWPASFKLPTPMPTFAAGKSYVFSIEQSPNSGVYFLVPGPEYTYP